jgi:hypothetical protein
MAVGILESACGRADIGLRAADEADPIGREPRHGGASGGTARRVIGQEFDAGSAGRRGTQTDDGNSGAWHVI